MKIKSLLAAVSMVAITAGSANALVLTNNTAGGTITPALELDTPLATPVSLGNFMFDVAPDPGGQYPGGANLVVTVDLPAGVVFDSNIQGVDLSAPAGTVVGSATVQNGSGQSGSSSVTFLASIAGSASVGQPIIFDLPLAFEDCVTGDLSVTVATEEGTPIEQGSVSAAGSDAIVAECKYALTGVPVESDAATSDTFITLASDFTALSDVGSNAPLDGVLGTIQLDVHDTVSVDLTDPMRSLDSSDIESVTFDVCFEDASAIDTVTVGTQSGVKSGNTFTFTVTSDISIDTLILGPNRIVATEDGTTPIVSQTPSVKNIAVVFDNDDLIDGRTFAGDNLDPLTREGIEFGYFDWNAGPAIGDPTFSVYRITGLPAGETVDYSVNLENSNNNGTFAGSITANSYGEAQLVSTTLPIPSDTGRFDFLLNIETEEDDVDVDRILFRGGVVSDFGGGANLANPGAAQFQPTNDSDSAAVLDSE